MKSNKQYLIILVILIVTLIVSVPLYMTVPRDKTEAVVSRLPIRIGAWVGKDLPIEERAYEILETKNLVLREYAKGNDKVYLYIIYSQDNRKVSHPPEVCFEGSGITIVKKDKIPLTLNNNRKIFANRLIVEKEGVNNAVVYWYKAGDYYTDNYLKQQLKIALNQLQFKHTSGALIRLSSDILPQHPDKALSDMKEFAEQASVYFSEIIP